MKHLTSRQCDIAGNIINAEISILEQIPDSVAVARMIDGDVVVQAAVGSRTASASIPWAPLARARGVGTLNATWRLAARDLVQSLRRQESQKVHSDREAELAADMQCPEAASRWDLLLGPDVLVDVP